MPSVKLKHENGSGLYSPGSSSGLDHTNNCFESDGSSKWSIKSSTIQRSLLFLHTTKIVINIIKSLSPSKIHLAKNGVHQKKFHQHLQSKNSLVSCSFMTNRKSQNFFDLKSRKNHPINYLLFTSIRGGQAWCWVMNLSGTRGTVTISKKITKKHHQMSTQKEKVFSISNRSNMTLSI